MLFLNSTWELMFLSACASNLSTIKNSQFQTNYTGDEESEWRLFGFEVKIGLKNMRCKSFSVFWSSYILNSIFSKVATNRQSYLTQKAEVVLTISRMTTCQGIKKH